MNYLTVLDEIATKYTSLLEDNLVGIYVHGSIAFGCYNPKKSDIDFLVVVKEKPEIEKKEQMIQLLLALSETAPKKGLEMSLVLEKECRKVQYPTPFELHFSNMHINRCRENLREYCETMNGMDPDLAAHFMVTRAVGYALVGQPVGEVFAEIPGSTYLDSIKLDIENATEEVESNTVYIVLNLCRVLAYIAEKKVLSKEQGGHWGLLHLPVQYKELIQMALTDYASEDEAFKISYDMDRAREFCDYMLRCIYTTEY